MTQTLTRFDQAYNALMEAKTVDEVKDVRDKAEALRLYVKQQGEGLEMQNACAEIKLRAERRAGEMLAEMPKDNGGRPRKTPFIVKGVFEDTPTLDDIGIDYNQSHRWQQIAKLPEETFEQEITEVKAKGDELTSAHMLNVAKRLNGRSMKPKQNYKGEPGLSGPMDRCQTPAYAFSPVVKYLKSDWLIWEPASGEGYLSEAIRNNSFDIIESDILTGQNFFEYEPKQWDCLVTNPPFSIKYDWLARCYEFGKPFALLLPVETIGAKSAQELFKQYDQFDLEIIFLDRRVNFKMPNKGWDGSAAQFPVAWFTWGLSIGRQIIFKEIVKDEE